MMWADDDQEWLAAAIDQEWLDYEEQLGRAAKPSGRQAVHPRPVQRRHGVAQPGSSASPAVPMRSSSARSPDTVHPPPCRRASSWSAVTKESGSGILQRMQLRIEELESQIAAAETTLSEAEKRAAQRKWAKERHAQRDRRATEPRCSNTLDLDAPLGESLSDTSMIAPDASDADDASEEAPLSPAPAVSAQAEAREVFEALAIVVGRLESIGSNEQLLARSLWGVARDLRLRSEAWRR